MPRGMERPDSGRRGNLGWLLVGAGIGALTTYLLDPDRGRRRQAMLRDHVARAGAVVGKQVPQKLRSLTGNASQDEGPDEGPTSPEWEIAHNDDGSLTGPSY